MLVHCLELSRPPPSILKSRAPPQADFLSLPKNRSTGNLLADVAKPADGTRIRFSVDAGRPMEYDPMSRPSVIGDREHGLGVSGLRWIRQQPPSRAPTLPPSPESSFALPSRSASMTIDISQSQSFTPGGPASPTLNFSEDLSRFPSESLHSFSFAHQSEDALHNRQNVLRRTIDFIDKAGISGSVANNPGLLRAQAKVSGDLEVQSMMELLARANVLGKNSGFSRNPNFHGPLTGPPDMEGENVFEKTLISRSESPGHMDEQTRSDISGSTTSTKGVVMPDTTNASMFQGDQIAVDGHASSEEVAVSKAVEIHAPRVGLKRTYTDTSSLSIQTKLVEALAKPYFAGDGISGNQLLSPTIIPTFGKSLKTSHSIAPSVHTHSHRWTPAAQAIFTTESKPPYTILAANDLACLVFGVTKAEIRKLGILEVVREDRRNWLEEKLRLPGSEAAVNARSPPGNSRRASPSAVTSSTMRGGITALLLSKPPARKSVSQRAQTDDGVGSTYMKKNSVKAGHHSANKSRGVLLCGDVVPILKRNGATGSATMWVKEKRAALIWVLEEIVEDMAYLTFDENGKVLDATGAIEVIWGKNCKPERMDILRLFPSFPIFNGQIDYNKVMELEHFTARHADRYHIPTSITARPALGELRVSSFPHIAGIMVLSSTTLEVTSSNSVFSAALFGQPNPDGLPITQLIPDFDSILSLIQEEEHVKLVDGIVVPEHSFRRARALLARQQGHADAEAMFLRPIGLPAKHRDGSNIYVDITMRVVKSETLISEECVIEEPSDSETNCNSNYSPSTCQLVYALWITYSRHLLSMMHTGGPVSPLISRPSTPPRQPSPGQAVNIITVPSSTEDRQATMSPTSLLVKHIEEATLEPISTKPFAQPSINITTCEPLVRETPKKKAIADYNILEEMGQGAYGQVKLARYKKSPSTKVVLKYVTKKRILMDCWYRG